MNNIFVKISEENALIINTVIEQLCQKLQKFGLLMKTKPVFSIENFPACRGTAIRNVEDINPSNWIDFEVYLSNKDVWIKIQDGPIWTKLCSDISDFNKVKIGEIVKDNTQNYNLKVNQSIFIDLETLYYETNGRRSAFIFNGVDFSMLQDRRAFFCLQHTVRPAANSSPVFPFPPPVRRVTPPAANPIDSLLADQNRRRNNSSSTGRGRFGSSGNSSRASRNTSGQTPTYQHQVRSNTEAFGAPQFQENLDISPRHQQRRQGPNADQHIYEQLRIPQVNQSQSRSSASEGSVEGPRMNPAEMVNVVSDILRRSLNTADSTEIQEMLRTIETNNGRHYNLRPRGETTERRPNANETINERRLSL